MQLVVGDSFGLLVDKFWFSIEAPAAGDDSLNGSASKRRCSVDSEPDSTTKKVKTEPIEFDEDNADTEHNETIPTNGRPNATDNETNHEIPSTSDQSANIPSESSSFCVLEHRPIKLEPMDVSENGAIAVKNEPQDGVVDSTNMPIKTEIKDEPVDNDLAAANSSNANEAAQLSANQPDQPTQTTQTTSRACCRYGIRCYR